MVNKCLIEHFDVKIEPNEISNFSTFIMRYKIIPGTRIRAVRLENAIPIETRVIDYRPKDVIRVDERNGIIEIIDDFCPHVPKIYTIKLRATVDLPNDEKKLTIEPVLRAFCESGEYTSEYCSRSLIVRRGILRSLIQLKNVEKLAGFLGLIDINIIVTEKHKKILERVMKTLNRGGNTVIVGQCGSGKTSILYMIGEELLKRNEKVYVALNAETLKSAYSVGVMLYDDLKRRDITDDFLDKLQRMSKVVITMNEEDFKLIENKLQSLNNWTIIRLEPLMFPKLSRRSPNETFQELLRLLKVNDTYDEATFLTLLAMALWKGPIHYVHIIELYDEFAKLLENNEIRQNPDSINRILLRFFNESPPTTAIYEFKDQGLMKLLIKIAKNKLDAICCLSTSEIKRILTGIREHIYESVNIEKFLRKKLKETYKRALEKYPQMVLLTLFNNDETLKEFRDLAYELVSSCNIAEIVDVPGSITYVRKLMQFLNREKARLHHKKIKMERLLKKIEREIYVIKKKEMALRLYSDQY